MTEYRASTLNQLLRTATEVSELRERVLVMQDTLVPIYLATQPDVGPRNVGPFYVSRQGLLGVLERQERDVLQKIRRMTEDE